MADLSTSYQTGDSFGAADVNATNAATNAANHAAAAAQATADAAARAWPFPMARNTIAAVGDSMSARWSYGQGNIAGPTGGDMAPPTASQSALNPTYLRLLPILSHQRIREGAGMYAVSNSWVTWQESIQLPYVLAMDPLPGACVLCCGAAEIVDNTAYSFTTNQGLIKSMVAQLIAVGVMPILWTIPPINTTVQVVDVVTINVRLNQWNVWIRRYAEENSFPLIDAHAALAAADGTHIPGPDGVSTTDDQLHPNGPGQVLIAQRALEDGLADRFAPNSLIHTARTIDDLTNMLNNGTINLGLFTTDSNSDGIADAFDSLVGTGTCSLVEPVPTDDLAGKWQQLVASAGGGATYLRRALSSGWSVGDTLAVACRVQTENMALSGAVYSVTLASNLTLPDNGIANWGVNSTPAPDIDDGEMYLEFEIQPGTTALSFHQQISSVTTGTATLRVGELTIRNLSTGGFLA